LVKGWINLVDTNSLPRVNAVEVQATVRSQADEAEEGQASLRTHRKGVQGLHDHSPAWRRRAAARLRQTGFVIMQNICTNETERDIQGLVEP